MQRLEVSGAVRPIYGSLGVKRLNMHFDKYMHWLCSIFVLLIRMMRISEKRYAHSKHLYYIHVFVGCLKSRSWKITCYYISLWFTACNIPFTGYEISLPLSSTKSPYYNHKEIKIQKKAGLNFWCQLCI